MKKLLLFTFVAFLLAVPANAKKPKLAHSAWFLFEKQDNLERQPNDSIDVSYKVVTKSSFPNLPRQSGLPPQPTIVMTIRNKSERTIYVDLQQSFVVINEEMYPLYIPTSDVTTTSNTSITGVNLGLVGVGSAGTTANTKIVHAERYVTIPGETKKNIEIPLTKWGVHFELNNVDGKLEFRPAGVGGHPNPKADYYMMEHHRLIQYFIYDGDVKDYEYEDNPLTLDMRVCYSFNDSMTPSYTNRSVYYTAHMVGVEHYDGLRGDFQGAIEKAKKIYPQLTDYINSPKNLYFYYWTPEYMPKK